MSTPITPTEAHQEAATRWFMSRPHNVNTQIDNLAQLLAEVEAQVVEQLRSELAYPKASEKPYHDEGTALTAERDQLRKDLTEIANGCGVGVPDQAEAKRRIIAIAAERDQLRRDVELLRNVENRQFKCLIENKASQDQLRAEVDTWKANWDTAHANAEKLRAEVESLKFKRDETFVALRAEVERLKEAKSTVSLQFEQRRSEDYIKITELLARAERAEAEVAELKKKQPINTHVRLFDLVRYMRAELHEQNLITDEEYSWLCAGSLMAISPKGGSPSPRRLEDYDELRAELASERARHAGLVPLLARWLKMADDCHQEQREVGHSEYNVTAGLMCDTRAAIAAAMKEDGK